MKEIIYKLDYLRRVLAGLAGWYIPRYGDSYFIGTTYNSYDAFFCALQNLYLACLNTALKKPELLAFVKDANQIWLQVALPTDINKRWQDIRKLLNK